MLLKVYFAATVLYLKEPHLSFISGRNPVVIADERLDKSDVQVIL